MLYLCAIPVISFNIMTNEPQAIAEGSLWATGMGQGMGGYRIRFPNFLPYARSMIMMTCQISANSLLEFASFLAIQTAGAALLLPT